MLFFRTTADLLFYQCPEPAFSFPVQPWAPQSHQRHAFLAGLSGLGYTWGIGEEGRHFYGLRRTGRKQALSPVADWALSVELFASRKSSHGQRLKPPPLLPPHLGKLHSVALCFASGCQADALLPARAVLPLQNEKQQCAHAHSERSPCLLSPPCPGKSTHNGKQVIRFKILPNLDSLSLFSPE